MRAVPFHFDAYGGLGEVQGLARLVEGGLELQFSTRDALFGVLKTGPRRLLVPFDALISARYRAGWFWLMPGIELRVLDLDALGDLPETQQGVVTLRLSWRDRQGGKALAAELDLLRSQRRIRELEQDIERLARQSPAGRDAGPMQPSAKPRSAGARAQDTAEE